MIFLIFISAFKIVVTHGNLLDNGDFEQATCSYTGQWFCMGGCTILASDDSHRGSRSIQVSNRLEILYTFS